MLNPVTRYENLFNPDRLLPELQCLKCDILANQDFSVFIMRPNRLRHHELIG
jgi:hypothetical protein